MIFQKSAFLCSDAGVELSMFFRKKVAAGLFGGEGFIMQKFTGNGIAFLEIDGYGFETIEAIKARDTYDTEDWLIIVTSDHGGIGTGHGGPSIQERMTFVVMNKEWN